MHFTRAAFNKGHTELGDRKLWLTAGEPIFEHRRIFETIKLIMGHVENISFVYTWGF